VNSPPGVEDPISAIFDLSDRVAQLAPVVRRMYRYTATILLGWIVIMAFVALLTFGANPYIAILAVIGLVAGVISLSLLRQTDRFFRGFVQRHRAIRLLREADPMVHVPEGRTPIERLARYLSLSNPRVEALLRDNPSALRYREAMGSRGKEVGFDLVIERPSSTVDRLLGRGESGFAILARLAPDVVTLDELRRLEADALRAAPRLAGPLVRVILLRPRAGPIAEEVYEYAVGHPVYLNRGWERHRLSLEIISENPDQTYDFIPHVLGVP
jgi:hypothetical protein